MKCIKLLLSNCRISRQSKGDQGYFRGQKESMLILQNKCVSGLFLFLFLFFIIWRRFPFALQNGSKIIAVLKKKKTAATKKFSLAKKPQIRKIHISGARWQHA